MEGEGWVEAKDLQLGDDIRKADGYTGKVESITTEETSQEMYNLTVDEAHTFFVGDGQWLVHNDARCLVVGENSFEYSYALHENNPNLNILATSYESFSDLIRKGRRWQFTLPSPEQGFGMLDNIDARILGNYFPAGSFDVAIFNHPYIDEGPLTSMLIADFLDSAPFILRGNSEIRITLTQKLVRQSQDIRSIIRGIDPVRFSSSEYFAPFVPRYSTGEAYLSPLRIYIDDPYKVGSHLTYIFK